MLLLHILYLYGEKLTELKSLCKRVARGFGVHVNLDDFLIVYNNYAVTDFL